MKHTYHFIPSLMIGGIEASALRALEKVNVETPYYLIFFYKVDEDLYNRIPENIKKNIILINSKYFLFSIFKALNFIFNNRNSNYIFSTWRSILISFFSRLFLSKESITSYYHRSQPAHILDKIIRKIAVYNSNFLLADSQATLISIPGNSKKRICIEPIFNYGENFIGKKYNPDNVNFCFVGRLAKVKNISGVMQLFMLINKLNEDSTIDIYGEDRGELKTLEEIIDKNDLRNLITYKGAVSPFDIGAIYKKYDFIISLSHTEGLAMSIVEAMSSGVVPLCVARGGPKDYCKDNVNSLTVNDLNFESILNFSKKISTLISDKDRYNFLSHNAHLTFGKDDFYEDKLIKFIKTELNQGSF